jgi:hypothetical protein
VEKPDDIELLRAIEKAAYTVGTSLDWADHGGGERAWKLIGEQPALARKAHESLSAAVGELIPVELLDRFDRAPEHGWYELQEAAKAALEKLGAGGD